MECITGRSFDLSVFLWGWTTALLSAFGGQPDALLAPKQKSVKKRPCRIARDTIFSSMPSSFLLLKTATNPKHEITPPWAVVLRFRWFEY